MNRRLRPHQRSGLRRLPPWQQVFLLLVGAAFLLQSYVTQTHIHPLALPPATANSIASLDVSAPVKATKAKQNLPSRDKPAPSDDPAKCPLCQAVGHAGNYVWPHAAVFVLPQLPLAIVPVAVALLRTPQAQSHDWRGRAPPRR